MNHVDRLYLKALRIKPQYDDVIIVTNETGKWMIKDDEFESLEAAQDALDNYVKGDDVIVIINDAPPGDVLDEMLAERIKNEREEDQAEYKDPGRDQKDTHKSHEHGCEWNDGQQESEYNHTWL